MLDLALWKEPQSSGAVLGGATLVYFVFEKLRYTALALVSQAMLVLVLGSAMWTAYCRFMNKCAAQPPLAPRHSGTHAPPQARAAGAQAGGVGGVRARRRQQVRRQRQRAARAPVQARHRTRPQADRAGARAAPAGGATPRDAARRTRSRVRSACRG